jgi:thioredoxin-like negative regulator of GroEL
MRDLALALRSVAVFLAGIAWLPGAALAQAAATPASARINPPSTNVAWQAAATEADMARLFALARSAKKPLLMYWGATWCPPCNQLKATFFNRQDFAALSASFVAVHVDGDRPGAQQLGRQYKVAGYPTVVVFNASGSEITRLPGEVDAAQMMAVLQQGLAGGRSVKAVMADALAGLAVTPAEWRLLAFYSWDTDEQQLLPKDQQAATLAMLAKQIDLPTPSADTTTATRLWLKALAARETTLPPRSLPQATPPAPLPATLPTTLPPAPLVVSSAASGPITTGAFALELAADRERLLRVLANPALCRSVADVLVNQADDLARAVWLVLNPTAPLPASAAPLDAALQRLQADTTLSRSDRLSALQARVELARLHLPKDELRPALAAPLVQSLREQVARDEREITDGYERQAVITAAAYALTRGGLWAESDALLQANLAKSHSPYYLMSQLATNARKQGQTEAALRWYGQAFDGSVGPATRLQWGTAYLGALVDLAPQDAPRIEKTASRLLTEAAADPSAFEARSGRALQRMGTKLVGWNTGGAPAAVVKRLQAQLQGLCPRVPVDGGQRAACQGLFSPAAKPAT